MVKGVSLLRSKAEQGIEALAQTLDQRGLQPLSSPQAAATNCASFTSRSGRISVSALMIRQGVPDGSGVCPGEREGC